MAFPFQTESRNNTHLPEVLLQRPLILREAVEKIGETQQIVDRKVRLHHEDQIRALGQQVENQPASEKMPSDETFAVAAEQIAAEASTLYEAEKIVDDEAVRLADAQRRVEEALKGGANQ
jgi:hypothetical protein